MTSLGTTRLARLAALCIGPIAFLSVMTPSSANEPVDPTEPPARVTGDDTGKLMSKGMSAHTVLTSTSGKKLKLSVHASDYSEGTSVTVSLSRGKESHSWHYDAGDALKIEPDGGGTLQLTSAQTGDRGKLDLKFSPTKPATTKTCGGKVAYKSRPMAVTGIAQAKTETKAWGTVGSATKALTFQGAGSVYWSYDVTCSDSHGTCEKSLGWSASNFTESGWTYVSGRSAGKSSTISGYRSVQLSKPEGASRSDSVTRPAPQPTFSSSGNTATMTAEGSKGTLTVEAANPFDDTYSCKAGTTEKTQKSKSWSGTATNGSKAFIVGAQIFGAFKVPNGSSGYISKLTY